MEPNPLLPSIPDLLLIGGIVLVVLVVVGVGLAAWLVKRSRSGPVPPPSNPDGS